MEGVLHTVGAVQLDTISVLARSHELVAHARVDQLTRADIESGLWAQPAHTFEYWSHAASILPMDMYPWFAFRRRFFKRRGIRWHEVPDRKTLAAIKRRLADGPATATDLGGAKRGGPWWDWSETKIGVEWLLDIGEVACTARTGWRRVYSLAPALPENPGWLTRDGVYGPADDDCIRTLVEASVRTLGVGTLADIADVHRLAGQGSTKAAVNRALGELADQGLVEQCTVAGWDDVAFRLQGSPKPSASSRTVMLSPFDSLVWNRDRVSRLFGMDYRLEAYVPSAKRVHGYFAMPVLHRGQLVARVDPGREDKGRTLVAKRVTLEPVPSQSAADEAVAGIAKSLHHAAAWVGATEIRVDDVVPSSAAKALRRGIG